VVETPGGEIRTKGRRHADVDITSTLTQAELRAAQKFLDSVEAKLRAEWDIA
jgi:hypothetical protein